MEESYQPIRIFDVRGVINDLKSNSVTELHTYKYFLGTAIVQIIAKGLNAGSGKTTDVTFGMEFLVTAFFIGIAILFTYAELHLCYSENRKGDDKDFLKRYVALAFNIDLILTLGSLAALGLSFVFLDAAKNAAVGSGVGAGVGLFAVLMSLITMIALPIVGIAWKVSSIRKVATKSRS